MDVNWWAIALPSVITGSAAFLGVLAGQRFTHRQGQAARLEDRFQWITGMICSENAVARQIGRALLAQAKETPEGRTPTTQDQVLAVWASQFASDLAPYDEDDDDEYWPPDEPD